MATPVLAMRGISKSFGAVQALSNVDFHVDAGEVVALLGDNGAGKSTLVKVISGVHGNDEGTIEFEGKEVKVHKPQDAVGLGIATVHQDLALCDNLDVVANLFLGRETSTAVGPLWLDEISMEKRAHQLLATLSVKIPSVRIPVASLSGGQRQSVSIARALLGQPKLVMLDEPTAALGVAQTAQVLDLISRLKEQGLAVLVISHNLADVFAVADRVSVLRLGKNGGDFAIANATQNEIVAAITGADLQTTAGAREGLPPVIRPASETSSPEEQA